eukprot:5496467-Amphidinium_carterae.1
MSTCVKVESVFRNKTTFKDTVQRSQSAGTDPHGKKQHREKPPPLRPFDADTAVEAQQKTQTTSPLAQKGTVSPHGQRGMTVTSPLGQKGNLRGPAAQTACPAD